METSITFDNIRKLVQYFHSHIGNSVKEHNQITFSTQFPNLEDVV